MGSSGGSVASVAVSGAENSFWSRFQTPWREGLVQRFSRRSHGAGGSSEGSARGRGVRRWGMQLAEEKGPSVQEQVLTNKLGMAIYSLQQLFAGPSSSTLGDFL